MFKKIIKSSFIALILLSLILAAYLFFLYKNLPDINDLRYQNQKKIAYILDSQDNIIASIGDEQNSDYTIFESFPKTLIDAVLAIEDVRFFKHYGLDFFAITRAFFANIASLSYKQGASTITQQLAKLYFLSPDKNLKRKLTEALLAIKIERVFSKEDILELYLNKAYFGSGNYGVAEASRSYFSKSIEEIDLNESALLAGLLKAPSKYSPKVNKDLSYKRTQIVLGNMIKYGFITEEEFVISEYEDKIWDKKISNRDNQKYFTDYIAKIYNDNYAFYPSNLKIRTSFNSRINNIVDENITEFYQKHKVLKDTDIAVVVLNKQGAILSMIGGYNYKKSQFNNAIYGKRQAGSAFKLFVYLEALKQGYKPKKKVVDEEVEIEGWTPQNYSGTYRGKMTLREAFVRSVNSVAAQIGYEVGLENIVNLAHEMGIEENIKPLPAITLGAVEVSPLELTTSYGVILNDGYRVENYAIEYIKDKYGNKIYEKEIFKEKILKKKIVKRMSDLLHGVVVWGTGRNANVAGLHIRGKTGTSQNYRDAWFIGMTEDLVICVWIGKKNDDDDLRVTGGSYPAKIFKGIVEGVYK